MLIDASHKKWIVAAAVAGISATGVYVALDQATPGGLTGGSQVGLIYGLAGSALMIFAGLLAAHRKLLRWRWVPRRSWWLKGHIWLGLLGGMLIWCHSGFGFGGAFEKVLWAVLALTLLTGMLGVLLQQYLPALLTARVRDEVPYEQIPHLCRVLRRESDALVAAICEDSPQQADAAAPRQLREFYENRVRPFLAEEFRPELPLAHAAHAREEFEWIASLPGLAPVRDQIETLRRHCEDRRQLGERERLYHWLHAWLILHVPLSLALLILGVAHAVMALYY